MTNDNQRTENLVAVSAPGRLDNHALATKFRLFDVEGNPIDVASFEARLAALEGDKAEENKPNKAAKKDDAE